MVPKSIRLTVAVEGMLDEAVLRRLVEGTHATIGDAYVKRGNRPLQAKIAGYNNAAHRSTWVVLTDLDHEYDCAPALVTAWLPAPARGMNLRVAVRSIEAWFLADRPGIAGSLGISLARVPADPDEVHDPKGLVVDLARGSRRREIRDALVPAPRSGRRTGPGYTGHLFEFVQGLWDPQRAAAFSPSLHGCQRRLQELTALPR